MMKFAIAGRSEKEASCMKNRDAFSIGLSRAVLAATMVGTPPSNQAYTPVPFWKRLDAFDYRSQAGDLWPA